MSTNSLSQAYGQTHTLVNTAFSSFIMTVTLKNYSLKDLSFECLSRPVLENVEDEFKREEAL